MKDSIYLYFLKNYGIGKILAHKLCFNIGVSPAKPANAVASFKKEQALLLLNQSVGFQLKEKELHNIKFYQTINNTKGFKFRAKLPVRGQRNKTNGKTAKKLVLKRIKF